MTDQITDKLLERIGHGRLKMRPRWYFLALAGLGFLGFALVFGVTFFLVAFLMLTVRTSGLTELPGFGWAGLLAFLRDFPWFLALLLLALMAGLELYARRFHFAYKRRAMTTLGVLVVLLGGAGIALGIYVERICPDGSPMGYALGRMRAEAMRRSNFVQRGTFVDLRDDAVVLMDDDGLERVIPLSGSLRLMNAPAFGDDVVIFMRPNGERFEPQGLRKRDPMPVLPVPWHSLCGSRSDDGRGQKLDAGSVDARRRLRPKVQGETTEPRQYDQN